MYYLLVKILFFACSTSMIAHQLERKGGLKLPRRPTVNNLAKPRIIYIWTHKVTCYRVLVLAVALLLNRVNAPAPPSSSYKAGIPLRFTRIFLHTNYCVAGLAVL